MTTHTPGPWYETTKGENHYQSAICQEVTGKTVALTYTSNDADARLIAAAPDMLEALYKTTAALSIAIANCNQMGGESLGRLTEIRLNAESVILKAEGRT